MEAMFAYCKATSLDLSNFDTSNVTTMQGMFERCQATSLDLSSFDTSKVRNMKDVFNKCQATYINFGRNKRLELDWDNRIIEG